MSKLTIEDIGYFSKPDQREPVRDASMRCGICGEATSEGTVRTHSVMWANQGERVLSLSFRTHRACDDNGDAINGACEDALGFGDEILKGVLLAESLEAK
jgi:hypothetical protein